MFRIWVFLSCKTGSAKSPKIISWNILICIVFIYMPNSSRWIVQIHQCFQIILIFCVTVSGRSYRHVRSLSLSQPPLPPLLTPPPIIIAIIGPSAGRADTVVTTQVLPEWLLAKLTSPWAPPRTHQHHPTHPPPHLSERARTVTWPFCPFLFACEHQQENRHHRSARTTQQGRRNTDTHTYLRSCSQ